MAAHFRHCLVITYALPADSLTGLLPPGLTLDQYNGYGFVAIALVQVSAMRPAGFPRIMGNNCLLAGYRIFIRFKTSQNKRLRGLRIIRSETDSRMIQWGGNLLTHYQYQHCTARFDYGDGCLEVQTNAADGLQLHLKSRIDSPASHLPPDSVFEDFTQARRFAGPLPFTFDYEQETHSIIAIRGDRPHWNPMPVEIDVIRCDFIQRSPFAENNPILSNAFYVSDISYEWQRGVQFPLSPDLTE